MGSADISIVVLDPSFRKITGSSPQVSICLENLDVPLFHEAGVFIEDTCELFVTSNQYEDQDGKKIIRISKINIAGEPYSCKTIFPNILMANGGVNYQDGILFCDQGNLTQPGGLIYMSIQPPYQTETIVSGFMGVSFNSVNDVVVAKDGAIWFTDPIYGYEQGIRPVPKLPPQIYRFDPSSKNIRAMADGFGRPNGIAFSPNESVLYITVSLAMSSSSLFSRSQDPKNPIANSFKLIFVRILIIFMATEVKTQCVLRLCT
jgi:gluconolactonase